MMASKNQENEKITRSGRNTKYSLRLSKYQCETIIHQSSSTREKTEDKLFVKPISKQKVPSLKENEDPVKSSSKQDISSELSRLCIQKTHPTKCASLKPLMQKRHNAVLKPTTPMQKARSRLHVSSVPRSLPCREEEFNNIFTFLKTKVEEKSSGCMYISGVPGTGKTATVNEVINCIRKLADEDSMLNFEHATINGIKLSEPRQAYVHILKQLEGTTVTWEKAYHILDKKFSKANSKMTVLVIDELDFLCTKRQDVIYNLLEWSTRTMAQLVIITIANTMDLPERVLLSRITSRLGLTRVTFYPYNYKQLHEIVASRLKGSNNFQDEAIEYAARKVSAISGDARRVLNICLHAIEIAESRGAEAVTLQDVSNAMPEMITSPKVRAIRHCSKMEQMFLQAVSAEVSRTSVESAFFKDIYYTLESRCALEGIAAPTITETFAICGRLSAMQLLIYECLNNDIYRKVSLNVSPDDIYYAIHEI